MRGGPVVGEIFGFGSFGGGTLGGSCNSGDDIDGDCSRAAAGGSGVKWLVKTSLFSAVEGCEIGAVFKEAACGQLLLFPVATGGGISSSSIFLPFLTEVNRFSRVWEKRLHIITAACRFIHKLSMPPVKGNGF